MGDNKRVIWAVGILFFVVIAFSLFSAFLSSTVSADGGAQRDACGSYSHRHLFKWDGNSWEPATGDGTYGENTN